MRIVFIVVLCIFIISYLATIGEDNMFKRILDLFRGKADRGLDKEAVKDPDAVYRTAIAEEERELREMDQLIREVKREEFTIAQEKDAVETKLKNVEAALEKALAEGNEEVGALAISEKDKLEAQRAELNTRLETFKAEQTTYMDARREQEEQVEELRREALMNKNAIKANAVLAGIRDRKAKIGSGQDRNLDAVRRAAFDAKADLSTGKQLDASNPANKLEAFMKAGSETSAKDRFAAMKAAAAEKKTE